MSTASFQIKSHGTPSAFTPGYIAKAGTLSVNQPISNTLTTTVNLTGMTAGDAVVISKIPSGCTVTAATFNSNESLEDGVTLGFGTLSGLPGAVPVTFVQLYALTASAVAGGVPGANVSTGVVNTTISPITAIAGNIQYLALETTTITGATPIVAGSVVQVKISYVCP